MKLLRIAIIVFAAVLFYLTLPLYDGDWWIYLLFSVLANAMLVFAIRQQASFVELFLSIFLWIGFWLKFSLRLWLQNGYFHEVTGSHAHFDQALLVGTIGMLAVIVAGVIRQCFLFNYPAKTDIGVPSLFAFYSQFRKWLLSAFILLVLVVTLSNLWLGIYQRGEIPDIQVPFLISGTYTWLLTFGLAGISAMVLRFELALQQRVTLLPAGIAIAETFFSSVSLLSRAMVLNVAALAYGVYQTIQRNKISFQWRKLIIIAVAFLTLFALSVTTVNYLRVIKFNVSISDSNNTQIGALAESDPSQSSIEPETLETEQAEQSTNSQQNWIAKLESDIRLVVLMTKPLFVDRWVGIEGVLGVIEHGELGWPLWKEAWEEKYSHYESSFYDLMINSDYVAIDKTKHHFINLPGMVAFLFYPGSLWFLFVGMVIVVVAGSTLEYLAFKLTGNNLIFAALVAQVIVFRITNFGYVPGQSYLLFGTILVNILMVYAAERLCHRYYVGRQI